MRRHETLAWDACTQRVHAACCSPRACESETSRTPHTVTLHGASLLHRQRERELYTDNSTHTHTHTHTHTRVAAKACSAPPCRSTFSEPRGVAPPPPAAESAETAEKPRLLPAFLPATLVGMLEELARWPCCTRCRAAEATSYECAAGRADVGGLASCGPLGAGCRARTRVSSARARGRAGGGCADRSTARDERAG